MASPPAGETDFIRFTESELHSVLSDIFTALGVPKSDAATVSSALVTADLRGIHSHGVGRAQLYVRDIREDLINPRTSITVVRDSPTTAVLDGGNGLGAVIGHRAMALCIEKAQAMGSGSVTVRGSNHYGIAGFYAMMAIPHDMIGLSLTNTSPVIVPTNAAKAVIGSNPIALAAPTGTGCPFVLDMSTAVVPLGKIEAMMRMDESLQPGWGVDGNGQPSTDPSEVYWHGGALPVGGPKGYGLALGIEILAAVLSGAAFADQIAPWQAGSEEPQNLGHFFSAWRIDAFMPVEEFKSRMDELIMRMHNAPKALGQERIYVPGEIECEVAERYRTEGIPVQDKVVEALCQIGGELGVDCSVLEQF